MNENRHIPVPWRVEHDSIGTFIVGKDEDNFLVDIATLEAEDRANADFIIRACNNYDKLLNTCEAISQIGRFNQYSLAQAIELARTAFEQAK